VSDTGAAIEATVAAARRGDKWAVARLVSAFEDSRPAAAQRRREILAVLDEPSAAHFVGFTGTPGAGKSTLIGQLALALLHREPSLRIAVLAVDPSSHLSGGALLGDRTRVRFPPGERRLYFRSQASERELGGLGRHTYPVCRLLAHLFDLVLVETVGTGQSEIEVQHLVDWVYLVLQPLAGDQIQFLKAGIMEIADAIVLNKCDEGAAAQRSYAALQASMRLARAGPANLPVHRTSATTGAGLEALAEEVLRVRPRHAAGVREAYFFGRWVRDEYGRHGLGLLESRAAGPAAYLVEAGSFELAQQRFPGDLRGWLGAG
jgi:LAO/AO transport system kinase